jgi:HSP20 family protein
MTVMRWDPFRQFDRITEQLTRAPRTMPMEAFRRGEELFVNLDLPGVSPEDVELTVERNVLSVKAERRSLWQEGDDVIIDETPQGTFSRQLYLGENLDTERLEASYDRGMLTMRIPVSEKAKPRRVTISGGESEPQQVNATSGQGGQGGSS